MSREIVNINIRFHMDRDDDRRAWEYLQNMDRNLFKSYTRAVVSAVNEYFDRQKRLTADPFLESREKEDAFLQRIADTVERSLGPIIPLVTILQGGIVSRPAAPSPTVSFDEPDKQEMEDTALDFINSF